MRQQLPVRSPLGSKAIRSGLWAASGTAAASIARAMVSLALRERFGVDRVVLTDSGTSALTLAIRGLDSGAGRPVAIPAYGCFDLATAVLGAGASFVLYDSDPATLGPDLDSLAKALSMGADRVVVAHLYGVPVDLLAVRALADSFGATIIEDAAQGAGASLDGMPLGSFGAAGVLSFGRGKGVTGGSGGALLLRADVAAAADPALRLKPGGRGSASEFVKLVA